MIALERQGFTKQELQDALHGRGGVRRVAFRFDIIRDGAVTGTLDATGSISQNRSDSIQRTARFTMTGEPQIDWLNDRIKPYLLLYMGSRVKHTLCVPENAGIYWTEWDEADKTWNEIQVTGKTWAEQDNLPPWEKKNDTPASELRTDTWAEFPLGVFLPTTPTRNYDTAGIYYEVECYDPTVILREDCLTERLFIPTATTYLNAVTSLLASAGIMEVMTLDSCDITLPNDREFEIGETKLEVINKLLSEINFNPIFCNADGVFVLSRFQEPALEQVGYSYEANELSVLYTEAQSSIDTYFVPNIFIAICSNPELEKEYRSEFINNNPLSKLSTVNRKRRIVSEIYRPDVIASQMELDHYIRKIAFEKNQIYEQLKFSTVLMPIHESGDVLFLRHPKFSGIYWENSWSMELSAAGKMTHSARKVISI